LQDIAVELVLTVYGDGETTTFRYGESCAVSTISTTWTTCTTTAVGGITVRIHRPKLSITGSPVLHSWKSESKTEQDHSFAGPIPVAVLLHFGAGERYAAA